MLLGVAIFYARPAYKSITRVTQPDGSSVNVRLVGDEYLHYNVTADGYSLVRRDDGAFVYAQLNDDGQLEPTAMLAHDANERSTEEHKYLKKSDDCYHSQLHKQSRCVVRIRFSVLVCLAKDAQPSMTTRSSEDWCCLWSITIVLSVMTTMLISWKT